MAEEIERKFLLWENGVDYSASPLKELYPALEELKSGVLNQGTRIVQGYIPLNLGLLLAEVLKMTLGSKPNETRLRRKGDKLYFTLKGNGSHAREELETRVSEDLFMNWWGFTQGSRVEKFRLEKPYGRYVAEIDVYTDRDLIIAEVEVPSLEIANSLVPLGRDVTGDSRYKNRNLAR